MSTIFSTATAPGKAGVAVIRVSGPDAFAAAKNLVRTLPPLRQAAVRSIWSVDGLVLDRGLVLSFPAGQSFTGEDTVELQVHGSPAITAAILNSLGQQPGLRPAEAGEFTRRALENERLDLVQVEGLADLVDAETELQRRQAMMVFEGEMANRVAGWRSNLVRALALLEATIDFVDEDVPVDVFPEVGELVGLVKDELAKEAEGAVIAERLRDGFEVAIVGRPNAGKSTLLNALAGRDVAIISDIPGTTRDVLEVRLDLDGIPVTFLDTAGIRETQDVVERMGVERAVSRANAADIRVFLVSDEYEKQQVRTEEDDLILWAKADVAQGSGSGVSGKTGLGVPEMLGTISNILKGRLARVRTATRQRHAFAINTGKDHLARAQIELGFQEERADLAAEEIRRALSALDELLGKIGVEAILDEIFSSFCIGK